MPALDTFLDTLPNDFDIKALFDPDVETIENTKYDGETIYKYYPAARRTFFSKPQVRFTPREALNDPFEMSRRWRETSAAGLKNYIEGRLNASLPAAFSNRDLLISMLAESLFERGITLTAAQRNNVEQILASSVGQDFLRKQKTAAQQLISPLVDVIFGRLEAELDQILDNVTSETGVLSLTEDARNSQMWAHYADQGKGFVVGFDTKHQFFFHSDGSTQRNLLRKVIYTDQPTENFWKNPYYLFLVKSTGWAYEKEWRVIKKLCDSHHSILSVAAHVHLWDIPTDMIKTIHFGYAYDADEMLNDMHTLRGMTASATFYRTVANRATGTLEEQAINANAALD